MKVARCIEAFIKRKRICGYEYEDSGRILRRFAVSVGDIEISLVTAEHINHFLSRGNLSNNVWRSHRSLFQRFFNYWYGRRQVDCVPEVDQKPPIKTRFFPYVYSRAEIARLLAATPLVQANRPRTIGPAALRTIVLFLYGTGMRVKEALAIRDMSPDFRNRSIEIYPRSSYNHRTLPIGRDVQRLLRQYLQSRERAQFGSGNPLFLTMDGQAVTYNLLRPTFRRLRTAAGVFRPNSHLPPRLRDLRHTFAVHSITRWIEAGWPVEHMLSMLTSYHGECPR